MSHEYRDAFIASLFFPNTSPFLKIVVRRDFALRDSMSQLTQKSGSDLRKKMRVTFVGEEGVDAGGVTKEWFQLLLRELLDPVFGMFTEDHELHHQWFLPSDIDNLSEFSLIGTILGLAIYNGVIIGECSSHTHTFARYRKHLINLFSFFVVM